MDVLGIDPAERWAQLALAKAIDGLVLDSAEKTLFETYTGREYVGGEAYRQILKIVGRQAGKTEEAADLLTYEGVAAALAGDRGVTCAGVAQDQRSALGALFGYVQRRFENPMLAPLVVSQTNDTITLINDVQIIVLPCRPAALRGRRCRIVVLDEICHFRNSGNIALDKEVWRAALPTLLTTGGRLFALSSPYAASGLAYDLHDRHYGKAGSSTLVWQSPGTVLHPTLDQEFMQQLRDNDPEGARAELDAEFLSNVSVLIDEETLRAAVDNGVKVRPPLPGSRYVAFVDVATGTKATGDAATLGIAHRENNCALLDMVSAWRPPFSHSPWREEMSTLLRQYGLSYVTGDRFAQGFTSDAFQRVGIEYRPSEADKSALYLQLAGALNSGTAKLLDDPVLLRELRGLERRRGPTKDRVDHRRGSHDDRANAAAGALSLAGCRREWSTWSGTARTCICDRRKDTRPMVNVTTKAAAAELLRGGKILEEPREKQLQTVVEHLAAEHKRLQALTDETQREEFIRTEMRKVRDQNTIEGVLVAPEEAFAKVEAAKRARYDEDARTIARDQLKHIGMARTALIDEASKHRKLPPAVYDPARRTLQLMERNELRLRYNGRPVQELLALYEQSSDKDRRDIVEFIEDECDADWPTLTARITEKSDIVASAALRQAIAARREARVPQWIPAGLSTVAGLDTIPCRLWLEQIAANGARASQQVVQLRPVVVRADKR